MIPLDLADASLCGPKAGTLAVLRRAGIDVPDGFVVAFDDHRDGRDPDPDHLARELARLGEVPLAVRSSAANEDSSDGSAAGLYATVLGVRGHEAVVRAIRTCWASLHTPRAIQYLRKRQLPGRSTFARAAASDPVMAVLVQRLVDAEVSGVMFTRSDGTTEIEGSWGLGPSIVEGTVTPDTFQVLADGSIDRRLAQKSTRLDRHGADVVRTDVPARDQSRPCLDDAVVTVLAQLAQRVTRTLGGPQDIEWALADGRVWILQSRPITAPLPSPSTVRMPDTANAAVASGTPGSSGVASGPARVVRGPADFARVRTGDILVCRFTDPAWTPLLGVVAGVVTEQGGVLSHAAILARERRIPAVLGVRGATTRLHEGDIVTIDGSAGTVIRLDSEGT